MRKRICCILMVLIALLFIIMCIYQLKNETVDSTEMLENTNAQNNDYVETTATVESETENQKGNVDEVVVDKNTGFSGEALDDSDIYSEPEEKTSVADEKQELDKSTVMTDSDDVLDNKSDSDNKKYGTTEMVPEESKDMNPIRDNTYEGNLVEPPKVGSDGDL